MCGGCEKGRTIGSAPFVVVRSVGTYAVATACSGRAFASAAFEKANSPAA